MNGVAGHSWFTEYTAVTLPDGTPPWRTTTRIAPRPSEVQNGREPSTPSSLPTLRLAVQTWVSRLCVPVSDLSAGLGRMSTTFSGPRLDADVAVGSYPSPACEGR